MSETSTMTLPGFLLARITEDAEIAHAALAAFGATSGTPPNWRSKRQWDAMSAPVGDMVRLCSPTRVLAECEAKRRIVDLHLADEWGVPFYVLMLLALPYADHPDYIEEWRP